MSNNDDGIRRCLDDEQKFNAKQLIDSGWAIDDVARHCGLTEPELLREISLPQGQTEQVPERRRRRFDMGGK